MASITKDIPLAADADTVWSALRDVGHAHHLFAGVLTDTQLDGDARVVTLRQRLRRRERIVDLDDDARRIAYAVVDGPFEHHHASMEVIADPDGGSRLVWITDLLPDDLAPMVAGLVDQGADAVQRTMGAIRGGTMLAP